MMALCCLLLLADPCVSGTPVGGRPGPYSFLLATGPDRGKQECLICAQDKKPTVVVFGRKLQPETGKLLQMLDAEMAKRSESGFKAWFTQLTSEAKLDSLSKWSQDLGLKTLTVGAYEDADGPPVYKIANDAEVTVLVFVDRKVVANFALRDKELTAKKVTEIQKSLDKLAK
ncbi:MAG: hypothetical protein ACRC8S_04070 [Fimbriiglobus sp.]